MFNRRLDYILGEDRWLYTVREMWCILTNGDSCALQLQFEVLSHHRKTIQNARICFFQLSNVSQHNICWSKFGCCWLLLLLLLWWWSVMRTCLTFLSAETRFESTFPLSTICWIPFWMWTNKTNWIVWESCAREMDSRKSSCVNEVVSTQICLSSFEWTNTGIVGENAMYQQISLIRSLTSFQIQTMAEKNTPRNKTQLTSIKGFASSKRFLRRFLLNSIYRFSSHRSVMDGWMDGWRVNTKRERLWRWRGVNSRFVGAILNILNELCALVRQ